MKIEYTIISISFFLPSQGKFTRKKEETRQIPYQNSPSSLISKRNSQNYFQRASKYYNQNSPSFLFLKIEYTIISISFFLPSQGKFTRKKRETRQIPYRNSSFLISKSNSQNYFQRASEYYNSNQNSPSPLFLKIEYTKLSPFLHKKNSQERRERRVKFHIEILLPLFLKRNPLDRKGIRKIIFRELQNITTPIKILLLSF